MSYPAQVKIVESLDDALETPIDIKHNVILYPRKLSGDFNAMADVLFGVLGRVTVEFDNKYTHLKIDSAMMRASRAAQEAYDNVRHDILYLTDKGLKPELKVQHGRTSDLAIHTYHHDGERNPTAKESRVFCCYNVAGTEGLRNEDAISKGKNYVERPGSTPFSFALGDIWRFATGRSCNPFIHRAPAIADGVTRITLRAWVR